MSSNLRPIIRSRRWTPAIVSGVAAIIGLSSSSKVDNEDEKLKDSRSILQIPSYRSFINYAISNYEILSILPSQNMTCECQSDIAKRQSKLRANLARKRTVARLEKHSTKAKLESKYDWHKNKVLGEGAYGSVYLATSKQTTEKVALKEISKKYTNSLSFQQEMKAMLYIRSKGGHPHLCSLHEHFDSRDSYYVILDYIGGGELFDHLINNGAYSELDASRLVREVASALNFLHGIGVVHADLKPENILLTTTRRGDSMVKLADFGCAQVITQSDIAFGEEEIRPIYGAPTPAYCPPESLLKTHPIQPSSDMWGLGVILFIMLTGCHPYDISGEATDEEIEKRIKDPTYKIPINEPSVAGHVSKSAKDLIIKLMHPNPQKRLTAFAMLQHPWVRGETATTTIIAGSDEKLSKFRAIKTKLQAKFFEDTIRFSDIHDDDVLRKTSLIERSFKALDLNEIMGRDPNVEQEEGGPKINLSDFQNLLSDNMKNRYFPAGHVVYREGDVGNHMYFIDSGTVQVECSDGSMAYRSQGDFFGEGALLHPLKTRSATVRANTPVHAIQISREYFEKYISSSQTGLYLTLKEKDKIRKRNRAKTILKLQNNLKTAQRKRYGTYFKEGESGDVMYILENGQVDLKIEGNQVLKVTPGNIFGEHSVLTGGLRNCTATCASREGCIAQELIGKDFRKLVNSSPNIQDAIRDLQLRREFKKAVVRRLRKEFPYHNPREAFQAADDQKKGMLDKTSIGKLMRELNPEYTEDEIQELLDALDITKSGNVTFDEFKKVFIADIRTAASM